MRGRSLAANSSPSPIMRCLPLPALVAALLTSVAPPVLSAPMIGEFQASNKDTIVDDDGATSDWIEIYNPDVTAVDLAGMALTDDPLLPQKWIFPSISIASNSSLLVWASGRNRTSPANPLHTNFDLAAEGGYLALTAADGTTKLSEFNPYPAQFEDRSYGSARPVIMQVVISSGAACRWFVPAAAVAGWQNTGFIDTSWNAGASGIGYDTETTYLSLIGAGGTLPTGTISCYIRVPFTMASANDVQTMTLRMKYDDGFAAFLNGTRLNPPANTLTNAPAALAFNSASSAGRPDTDAVVFQSFDISGQKSLLINGTNVLALQALNNSTVSSDFLCLPELQVTKADSSAPFETGYFARPTPGVNNATPPVDGFTDAPDFSTKRGFFTAPVPVTLTTHTAGAAIRYTTNGSAPTATTGTLYSGPVTISSTVVLRAGAFLPGWEPSTVKSHTYIFPDQVKNQPAAPAGYPSTWGNGYDFNFGTLTGPAVPADYRMDPGVTGNATYSPLIVPALSTTLPVVSLSTNITSVFGTAGIYSNGRITPGTELPVSIEYFNVAGTEKFQEDAGLRMHGGDAPIEHPKKPFRVYFRKDYGVGRLKFPLFPGSDVESFDSLQLRPGGHDGWSVPFGSGPQSLARHATYLRDRYLRQCELDMGRTAVRGKYVHLYLNGLYWGVYDLHEVPSKEYFSDHLGGEEPDWDVVEHSNSDNPLFQVVDGSGAAMDSALALCRPATNLLNDAIYLQLQQYINMDEFIDHMIVQMWGAQNDWMGPVYRGTGASSTNAYRFFNKNWEAGRRSRGPQPGQFYWNVWDAEISMGNSLSSFVATMRVTDFDHTRVGTPSSISGITGSNTVPGPPAEIYYALRQNPSFRVKFADRLQKHFFNGGVMTQTNNLARITALQAELNLPIVAESARWGDVNSGDPDVITFMRDEHWLDEVNWLKNTYFTTRNATLLNQFRTIGIWPSVNSPAYSQHGGVVPSGYQLVITDPNAAGGTIYYTLDGSDPMSSPAASAFTLLGPDTPCQFKVPAGPYDDPTPNSWKSLAEPADIATWTTGTAGVGFDANPTFLPHITTIVSDMRNVNGSLYVRIPFTVTAEQKASMSSLSLKLKYDDGAFVFLNGSVPLQRLNAPNSPAFNGLATAAHADSDAVNYQYFDLTSQIASLNVGSNNLLALQGLNITVADDDFLCVPELFATVVTSPPPAAGALTYTGAVTLPQSGTVKSRVLKNGVWSPLTEASFIVGVPAGAGNLTITEFSYNPVASAAEITAGYTSQQFEFIELLNISSDSVELAGCRFDDGISFDFASSSEQTLTPGQRILLVSNEAAFNFRHPGVPVAGVFANASNLSNSGERLELLDALGGHIFDFTYDDDPPWPASPDGQGYSLALIHPVSHPDPGLAANWRASVNQRGTPGDTDADSFAAWAARNSVTSQMSADSNQNGLTNLAEYGLGLTSSSEETDGILSAQFESVDVVGTLGTYLVLRYRHNAAADDVLVAPEMSTNMTNWTPLTDDAGPSVTNPDGSENLARRSPQPVSAGARVFVRVSVTTR